MQTFSNKNQVLRLVRRGRSGVALWTAAVLAALGVAACFNPDFGAGGFACPDRECPAGYTCCSGKCVTQGTCAGNADAGPPPGKCTKPRVVSRDVVGGKEMKLRAERRTFDLALDRRGQVHIAFVTDQKRVWYYHPGSALGGEASFEVTTDPGDQVSLAADSSDRVVVGYVLGGSSAAAGELRLRYMDASKGLSKSWNEIKTTYGSDRVENLELDAYHGGGDEFEVRHLYDRAGSLSTAIGSDLREGPLSWAGGTAKAWQYCKYEGKGLGTTSRVSLSRLAVGPSQVTIAARVVSGSTTNWVFRTAELKKAMCPDTDFVEAPNLAVASDGIALAQGKDGFVHAVYAHGTTVGTLALKHTWWTGTVPKIPPANTTDLVKIAPLDPISVDMAVTLGSPSVPVVSWFQVDPTTKTADLVVVKVSAAGTTVYAGPTNRVDAVGPMTDPSRLVGHPTRLAVDDKGVVHVVYAHDQGSAQTDLRLRYVTCQ